VEYCLFFDQLPNIAVHRLEATPGDQGTVVILNAVKDLVHFSHYTLALSMRSFTAFRMTAFASVQRKCSTYPMNRYTSTRCVGY